MQCHSHPCSVFSIGFTQTNIAILPSKLADDFKKFAAQNSGAIPVVHCSGKGDASCHPLSLDSDIRTDLPAYNIFQNGKFIKTTESLTGNCDFQMHIVTAKTLLL